MTRLPSCVISGTSGRCRRWMRRRASSDCVGLSLAKAAVPVTPTAAPAATARGAIAVQPNILLLDMSAMSSISFLLPGPSVPWPRNAGSSSALRHQNVVSLKGHVPQGHHGVIFMDHVVTVDGVFAQPIAEAEE